MGYAPPVRHALHEELLQRGVVGPVELDTPEEQRWLDCDLASLAEHRLGVTSSPLDLGDALRRDWQARATLERSMRLSQRGRHERCYWLLEDGARVGTMALALDTAGSPRVHLASFYVLPSLRGQGVGRRAMARLREVCARHDLGLRLDTSWTWQRTVRFYLGVGMWIYMWKRDLVFCWDPRTPDPHITVGEDEARLSIVHRGAELVLAQARRRGDALDLEEPPDVRNIKGIGSAFWNASSTLSLALAMKGWPLIRSSEHWEKQAFADAGPPEALAQRIVIWEAWERKNGWRVETPTIPALDYPSWDELELRWAAERAALSPGKGG
jgi:GNAT superfamily N-acetyltransferase